MKNEDLYDQREREILEDPGKVAWKVIKWFFGVSILLGMGAWAWSVFTTPFNTAKDIVQKTLKADNVLQNYEWFKQQNADYIAIQVKIAEADSSFVQFKRDAGPRSGWTFEDKASYSQLQTISTGLRYQKADIAAKYNARSVMQNRSLFKTRDLPDQLPN